MERIEPMMMFCCNVNVRDCAKILLQGCNCTGDEGESMFALGLRHAPKLLTLELRNGTTSTGLENDMERGVGT